MDMLFDEREAVAALTDRKKGLDALKAELHASLVALADEGDRELPVLALAGLVKSRIERLSVRWEDARRQQAEIAAARQAIARREQALASLKTTLEAQAARYGQVLAQAGLKPETGLEAAATALQLWNNVPPLVEKKERLSREDYERTDAGRGFPVGGRWAGDGPGPGPWPV